MIFEQETINVLPGLDAGKTGHHAVALNRAGKKLYDKALPQDQTETQDVITGLAAHEKVLVVVDQPAVAQAAGASVGYLSGLGVHRIADRQPQQKKTDARGAAIIAEAARSMPHTLRSLERDVETPAELGVLCGCDDDLSGQITSKSNGIRRLLTQIHPALEWVLGPRLDHPAVADQLTRYPTPEALKTAGRDHVRARLKKHAPRAAERLDEAIFSALGQRTVVAAGTSGAGIVLPKLTDQLLSQRRRPDEITTQGGQHTAKIAESFKVARSTVCSIVHRILDKQEMAKTRDKGPNGISGATS